MALKFWLLPTLRLIRVSVCIFENLSNHPEESSYLSLIIPTLIGLLKPSSTKAVSDLSLKAIQNLGASHPTDFKEIADSLPSTHRKFLEDAANAQKQQEIQTQRVVSKRKQRAKPAKELTLDFSQYE